MTPAIDVQVVCSLFGNWPQSQCCSDAVTMAAQHIMSGGLQETRTYLNSLQVLASNYDDRQ